MKKDKFDAAYQLAEQLRREHDVTQIFHARTHDDAFAEIGEPIDDRCVGRTDHYGAWRGYEFVSGNRYLEI